MFRNVFKENAPVQEERSVWERVVRTTQLRDRRVQLVYCNRQPTKDLRKSTGSYNVIDYEYTTMGFYKEFDSKAHYELYCSQKVDLDMRVAGIDEQNEARNMLGLEPCDREELSWLDDAREFMNRWGESYVPENIRCAMDGVLFRKDEEHIKWTPFVAESKKQIDISEKVDYYNTKNSRTTYTLRLDDTDMQFKKGKKRMKNVVTHDIISGGSASKRILLDGNMWVETTSTKRESPIRKKSLTDGDLKKTVD